MNMNAAQAIFALNRIPQLGPRRILAALDHFGSAESIWLASRNELKQSGRLPTSVISYFFDESFKKDALEQYELEMSKGSEIIAYTDSDYPGRLRNIPDPPMILYAQGSWRTNQMTRIVSIVGTRKPTRYGMELVEECISALKPYQPVIVSGMAFGIDAHAHRTALKEGLSTLGVMANGLGKIYPTQHNDLARKIVNQGGLLTEYAYDVTAEKEFFPMRNRIVAGMADVTIVVESGRKGGSMITAWMANEYQREVCTFPGSLYSKTSEGPHQLIKDHQAHLIEGGADVAEIMGWNKRAKSQEQLTLFSELTEEEKQLTSVIRSSPSIHIDALTLRLEWPPGNLALQLIQLEMKGLIRGLPGNRWEVVL